MVQRKAARFVKNDYSREHTSFTNMLLLDLTMDIAVKKSDKNKNHIDV